MLYTRDVCDLKAVRSLRFRRRVLSILSRARSRNIRSSGLWSTPTIKVGQPNTKKRALSKPYVTARASPSVGAYLDSAG